MRRSTRIIYEELVSDPWAKAALTADEVTRPCRLCGERITVSPWLDGVRLADGRLVCYPCSLSRDARLGGG